MELGRFIVLPPRSELRLDTIIGFFLLDKRLVCLVVGYQGFHLDFLGLDFVLSWVFGWFCVCERERSDSEFRP